MRILPINNYNNIKTQNFNGLWGKNSFLVDRDSVLGVTTDIETYYYYPFSDESPESINEVLKKNKTAYIDHNAHDRYIIRECKLCTTLPFKEVNFNTYKDADSSTKLIPTIKKVHYLVMDKYLNNTGEQRSAINPIIAAKLDTKA